VLAAALLTIGGLWYGAEGYQLVGPLFDDRFSRPIVGPNGLRTLHLDIRAGDYQVIAMQRLRAVQTGILQGHAETWQEAAIRFQGTEIPVRVRLKGDESEQTYPAEHWQSNKWSMQINTQEGTSLLGMGSFSLRSPATSAYLNQWLYSASLRRAGILAPRYTFVNLSVNERNWGVYALQEAPSKEFLASQQRSEGVIVRPMASLTWILDRQEEIAEADATATLHSLPAFAQMDVLYPDSARSDAALSGQAIDALGLLQAYQSQGLTASQVFDAELLGRYMAHANLWGTGNGLAWYDEHHYYNPLKARLEPIGYDAHPFALAPADSIRAPCDDLAVVEAYVEEAKRISQPEYLKELQSAYGGEFSQHRAALLQEFFPEHLEAPWDALVERQALLRASLHPAQTVYAYQSSASFFGDEDPLTLDLQVSNLLHHPIVLQQIRVGQDSLDVQPAWVTEVDGDASLHVEALPTVVLRSMQVDAPTYITLRIPTTALNELIPQNTPLYSSTLQLVTSLVGVKEQVIVDVQWTSPPVLSKPVLPEQPSIEEALNRYPFLAPADQPGLLALRPGKWHVIGDLVLPDGVGLWADEPVTLTFDRGAVLFSTGPLLLHSPDGEQIYFGPRDGHWAGIIILDAGLTGASSLYGVEIRGARGVRRGGWTATGGITFYKSPVIMSNCRVLDSFASAAITVVRADLQIVDTEFGYASGNAFDGDFVHGSIERCGFHDILGNGINASGSDITIQSSSLIKVHDTAIVAGQGSLVTAQGIRTSDVGIAIASKDASSVHAQDVRIAQAWIAGFAAYRESAKDGLANIQAVDVTFEDQSAEALVQMGSSATINGIAVQAQELDTSKLRRPREVSPPMQAQRYRFGPAIWLSGYEIATPRVAPGQRVQFVLYWRAFDRPDRQYTIFVHIVNASGETVAGWDSMPRHNSFPTTDWPISTLIDDPRFVPLPQDLPSGEYHIALGMYDWTTGVRLPVQTTDGQEIPDARIILDQTFTVE
jgi:hypothetical protein